MAPARQALSLDERNTDSLIQRQRRKRDLPMPAESQLSPE